jgi:hypothetical protein
MRVLPTLSVVVILAACGQAETSAQAPAASRSPVLSTFQAAATPAGATFVLEFDLPEEFAKSPTGSATAVTGFRVGYFRGTEAGALRTLDIARDAVIVNGQNARITLPVDSVPGCAADCVLRMQTVASGVSSAWSEPVAAAQVLTPGAAAAPPSPATSPRAPRTPRPTATRSRQAGRGLPLADLERYPALNAALRKLLPPDANLEDELRRFRRIDDLAQAVAISRDFDIEIATLSKTLVGPPRMTARAAIAKLRPDVDARSAIRKSREEAAKLTKTTEAAVGNAQ